MSVARRRGKHWAYRRWVRYVAGDTARRIRITGVPATWGLSNTRVGAETAEAKNVEFTLRTGKARPDLHAPPPSTSAPVDTVRSFAPTLLDSAAAKGKASTLGEKRQALNRYILPRVGDLSLAAVNYAVVEDLKIELLRGGPGQRPLSAKSVTNVMAVLHRLLVVAVLRGKLAAVPVFEWLRVPRPDFDFLTFSEADRLLAAATGEDRAFILTGLRTGMRMGELRGLRWGDVDLVAGRLVVRRSIVRGTVTTPKNHKPREIPLSPELEAALRSHRHLRGEPVFATASGTPIGADPMRWMLDRVRKRAGLRPIGWHVLRHTFASHLAMRGVPLKTIMELMGHSTMAMVLRYAHLAPDVAREAVQVLDAGHPVPDGVQNDSDRLPRTPKRGK